MCSLIALLLVICLAVPAPAQVSLRTLSEMQVGNLPDRAPPDLRTIYHQFNLDYSESGFQVGLRAESFGSSGSGRNYGHLAQRFAHYRHGDLHVTAGHFFAIVGNGLLLRAFELPGVITEERGSRRRYQPTRDLDGVQLSYRWHGADIQLLRGTPVDSALPPELCGVDRRSGTVQGGAVQMHPWPSIEVGFGFLELKEASQEAVGATTHARLRLVPLLERLGIDDVYADVYGEYAHRDVVADRWFSLDRELSRALYLSATATAGGWGLSLEYKDYQDFLIGGVNNPPTLIREHDVFLLNRDTHDLLADDETGVQTEVTYGFEGGQMLTANITRANRRQGPGQADDMDLAESFFALDTPLSRSLQMQLWVDFSRDQIFADDRRKSVGSVLAWQVDEVYTLNADVQFQSVDRAFGDLVFPHKNLYLNLGLDTSDWSGSLLLQRSTDTLESGASPDGATLWWGGNLNWRVRPGHSVNLFAGKRRFGLACTAGTCYEVLGFEGVELRAVNQFFYLVYPADRAMKE